MSQTVSTESSRIKLSGPIAIGKDILELLSSAMYVNPLSVYREYVQNAADALDEAAALGLLSTRSARSFIEITVDPSRRWARIRDYGTGLPKAIFSRTLTSIGGSRKRGTQARGFRGVGRLAGLGYCQELVMRSKAKSDSHVMAMHWDCKKFKEMLRAPGSDSLEEILSEIVTTTTEPQGTHPDHFFEIEMHQVVRYNNNVLLNEEAIYNYLAQIGPVPFAPEFTFGQEIQKTLAKHNVGKTFAISINGKPVFRPYRDFYLARPNVKGKFIDLQFFEIPSIGDGIDAVGWILHGDYLGAIPKCCGIKGIRLRIGNMQIGGSQLLTGAFPEPRFNSWAVGECHALSQKLVPNARRDNLEQNNHCRNLLDQLMPHAKEIARQCREQSSKRTRERVQAAAIRDGQKFDWGKTKEFLLNNAEKTLPAKQKSQIEKVLRAGRATYADLIHLLIGASESKNGNGK